ncbi:uncharacterized protein LACBIDRAFT_311707 [Laccaria bicolor S238N-H82]|uniref:Predicted protein n=1 Tax=Laccaria bicolor (strain S238N-H82 / ATCC MYA-4686) TaxID=486041 RepID=B0CY34_LACBS|nr:uncharacterized protein LACBIDRAFT_311707 [Laccaria bicolor S238N-H82]EDR12375.1 predicted protein [Laccaria bicolor S238N-H82]|eukprot:XP_001876639.1 predicted protein [Laccaria bicolor S238N-H82]
MNSNTKGLKKRVSIACVKCRDRKVKCIPVPDEEPPRRCTRCKEKNQPCQYMTVTAQSEQRGSLPPPAQTDCYPYYESSPPPATPVYPLPPPLADSNYSYPQQPFSNQPYSTSAYQNSNNQNAPHVSLPPPSNMSAYQNTNNQTAPSVGFPPPSNMSPAFQAAGYQNAPSVAAHMSSAFQTTNHQNATPMSFSPPSNMSSAYHNANNQNAPSVSFSPPAHMSSAFQTANHQNAPSVSFSPPSNMSSGHQAFSHGPPRQAVPYGQPSSPIRSRQDASGNYGTHGYTDSTYHQAQSTHQMPPNGQQSYYNHEWRQGNN